MAAGARVGMCGRGFYFEGMKKRFFHSFGLKDSLLKRLKDINIEKPTAIQEKALGPVLEGKNTVINAETGSGKTFCYLLPIINKLLVNKELLSRPPYAVVLLPSIELCRQVASVFRGLTNDTLLPCIVHRESKLLINPSYPVILATPNALFNYKLSSLDNVQVVVTDEADLLITSGGDELWEILSFFKGVDSLKTKKRNRRLARQQKASREQNAVDNKEIARDSSGQSDVNATAIPSDTKRESSQPEIVCTPLLKRQFVFVAATLPRHGPESAFNVLKDWLPDTEFVSTELAHCIVPTVDVFYVNVHDSEKLPELLHCLNSLAGVNKYPFACSGKKSNDNINFKDEERFNSSFNLPFGQEKFEKVYPSEEKTVFRDSNNSNQVLEEKRIAPSFGNVGWKNLRVLVFVNSVKAAEQAFNFLSGSDKVEQRNSISWKHVSQNDKATTWKIEDKGNSTDDDSIVHTGTKDIWIGRVGLIHKKLPLSQRINTLNKFKLSELKVLICTDLASRGLDIQDVSHVIQLDFAPNVAQVLHRTGRTARTGASGKVINFVTKDDEDLATAVQACKDSTSGNSCESHFSQNRQFRRRLKKKFQSQLNRQAKEVSE